MRDDAINQVSPGCHWLSPVGLPVPNTGKLAQLAWPVAPWLTSILYPSKKS